MNIRNRNNVEPVNSLYPKPERTVNWTFIVLVTGLTLFFATLLVLMLIGFKGVESGYTYNGGLVLCIFGTL